MSESQNVKLIQDAYAAFGRRDIPALLEMLSADVDWQTFGPKELPMSEARRGRSEVEQFFQQVEAAWDFERFDPREFVAQGDTVVALGSYAGTAKTTHRRFGCEWSHVFVVRNGRIARFREYTDTHDLLSAYASNRV